MRKWGFYRGACCPGAWRIYTVTTAAGTGTAISVPTLRQAVLQIPTGTGGVLIELFHYNSTLSTPAWMLVSLKKLYRRNSGQLQQALVQRLILIVSTDQTIYCGVGSSRLYLPAATGSQRVIMAKATGVASCAFVPYATDTIDGQNVSFTVPLQYAFLTLIDSAPGAWGTLAASANGYNNYGASPNAASDVAIGATYTNLWSNFLPASWAMSSDMCVSGQVEFVNGGGSAGTVTIAIGLWNRGSSSPTCVIEEDLPDVFTPVTRPFTCCAYNPSPVVGADYFDNIYAKTALPGVVVKYLDTTGTGYASYANVVINPTFNGPNF